MPGRDQHTADDDQTCSHITGVSVAYEEQRMLGFSDGFMTAKTGGLGCCQRLSLI